MMKTSWITAIAVAAVAAAALIGFATYHPELKSVRIGYAISLTGPNALGAGATVLPNYRLWAKEVNAAGGIMLRSIGKRVPVEIIEYDDESAPEKALAATERLITRDKVDFILAPWGTGLNMTVGPVLHDAGYPHLAVPSDRPPELAKQWTNSFWFLGENSDIAKGFIALLYKLRSEGRLGNRIALVCVADQLGIRLGKAARAELAKDGFDLVYDRSYAVGQTDMREIILEAKQQSPDAFLAFSYPPGTMALTEQAREAKFNPKIFFTAIGTAFPDYQKRFGADAEGVLGMGGWNPNTPESKDYRRRHLEATGQEPDRWASPIVYAALQMLQQAIENVGSIDRAATIRELQTGTFQTILGPFKFEDNSNAQIWWIGQWQHGEYYGIAPASHPGAQEMIFPKPAWHDPPMN